MCDLKNKIGVYTTQGTVQYEITAGQQAIDFYINPSQEYTVTHHKKSYTVFICDASDTADARIFSRNQIFTCSDQPIIEELIADTKFEIGIKTESSTICKQEKIEIISIKVPT